MITTMSAPRLGQAGRTARTPRSVSPFAARTASARPSPVAAPLSLRHEAIRALLAKGRTAARRLPALAYVERAAVALDASPVPPLLTGAYADPCDLVGRVATSTDPHGVMMAFAILHAGAERLLEQARRGDAQARVGSDLLWRMVGEAKRIFATTPRS